MVYQNTWKNLFNIWPLASEWRHYQKQWENSDLHETEQMINHSNGNDESFPKM